MSFFDVPPKEPKPERRALPPWMGPPEDELGVLLPLETPLGASPGGAIRLQTLIVYSTGVLLNVAGRHRAPDDELEHDWVEPQSDAFLRVGVELADGSKVTNLRSRSTMALEGEPEPPTLEGPPQHGIGGVDLPLWLWPLPPPGQLRVVAEWPAAGIPETSIYLDTAPILAAAAAPVPLWE